MGGKGGKKGREGTKEIVCGESSVEHDGDWDRELN